MNEHLRGTYVRFGKLVVLGLAVLLMGPAQARASLIVLASRSRPTRDLQAMGLM